jgi:hypothetical protein
MARLRTALALLVLAGCSSPGVFIAKAGNGTIPKMGTAPVDGTYGLFIAGHDQPDWQVPLKAGDPLGFESVERPMPDDLKMAYVRAVAGKEWRVIDERQTNEWRRL